MFPELRARTCVGPFARCPGEMRRGGDPVEDIRLGFYGDIVSHVVVEEAASVAETATSSLHSASETDSYAVGVIGIFPDGNARESEIAT
jgi:hypothetical protein